MDKNSQIKVIPSRSLWALVELDHGGIRLRKRNYSNKEQPKTSYLSYQNLTPNTEPLTREMGHTKDLMGSHKDFAAGLKVGVRW